MSRVIFTNGCFDILHRGHVELFEFCHSIGDKVIVGLNSDSSVKKLKGDSRPINSQNDRKKILESIKWIDEVIIFEDETPIRLIEKIMPDIIVKGGDYSESQVIGNKLCKVRIFNYVKGYSTTKTIQNISNR